MYKSEYETKLPVDVVHVVLHSADVAEYMFTRKQYNEAEKWIRYQGYHLWESGRGVGIRLEQTSYTVISVVVDREVKYREDDWFYPIIDATCYAVMLLYQRLKRDKVIA